MTDVWAKVKKVYDSIPAIWRDVMVAVLVILVLMGGLWTYTGQPVDQAPLVVVESGSMMHPDPPFGRIGTIDPGDLILVKSVKDPRNDVVTMYGARSPTDGANPGEGARDGYGGNGDVVIYKQEFCPDGRPTPIIHRAITWVEVENVGGERRYSYHDETGAWRTQRPNVHLPEVLLNQETAFTHSGWVTKGDNPSTNRPADQNQICEGTLIKDEWLIGKARGEIPWIGLLKFIVQGNNWETSGDSGVCIEEVGNARAPCDTFTMLWITLGVLILIPLVWDITLRIRRHKEAETEAERRRLSHPSHGPQRRPFSGAREPRSERPPTGRPLPARPKPRWARDAEEDAETEAEAAPDEDERPPPPR